MKLICTKENLKRALNLTSKIIGSATTLPILNNLLLKTESGQLKISSTNLEIAIKTWVGGQIEEPGEITVPAKTIADFVNNITEEKISLATEKNNLLIKTSTTQSLLKGLPAEEFPLIPDVKPEITLNVPAAGLATAFSQVAFATAFSETQPELSGVLLNLNNKFLKLAATDRYRLAEKTLNVPESQPNGHKVIIPNRAVAELGRILNEEKKEAIIIIAENQIVFRTTTAELISRIIEGQYPDYQQIIPKEFNTEIVVDTQELIAALKLTGLFVQENNNIELEILSQDQSLVLSSTSQKFGSNTTKVKGAVKGTDNKIIFNYRYILDCLNHQANPSTTLKLIDNTSPALLMPTNSSDYIYLVMPIKI